MDNNITPQSTSDEPTPNSVQTDAIITNETSPDRLEKAWNPQITEVQPKEPTTQHYKPLTRKRQAFVQYLVNNPKASATEAVKATYNITNPHTNTANDMAHELMQKPEIKLELAKYSGEAENTLVDVMQYARERGRSGTTAGASYASVASANARDILDRIHGKATQKIEQHTSIVQINVDLAGAK